MVEHDGEPVPDAKDLGSLREDLRSPSPMCDGDEASTPASLEAMKPLVEALLFVADEPVSTERLCSVLGADEETVEQAIGRLTQEYCGRGIRVQRKGRRVQLVTAPEAAEAVECFLGLDSSARLSPAALETLAIIAYKQPVTRADVEAVRGVQSDSVIRSLVTKGLIEEMGRLEQAGRPILYGTTFEFLQHFGLQDLSELPPLAPDEDGIPDLPERRGSADR